MSDDGSGPGVDNPHQAHASPEPFADFLAHVFRRVVRGYYLNDKVGEGVQELLRNRMGNPVPGNEGAIRRTNRVRIARDHETGFCGEDSPEVVASDIRC